MPVNQPAFDRYTSAHAGFGVLFATAGLPWWAALGISVSFEAFENQLKDAFPAAFPFSSHDSVANTIGDTAALMAGFAVARTSIVRGLSGAGEAALDACVEATIGGFLGAVVGGTAGARGLQIGERSANWGDIGYRAGSAIGGARATANLGAVTPAAAAAAGGAGGGPVGAALAAYVAATLSDHE